MASTNKTSHYELSQYVGSDKPTYLTDYNNDMSAIDTGIYNAQTKADSAFANAGSADTKADTALANAGTAMTSAGTANTNIGTMANLTTTEKSSLVGAINEVNAQVGQNTTDIAKFNFTSFTTYEVGSQTHPITREAGANGTLSGSLTLATNSDGSICKVYGSLELRNATSGGWAIIQTDLRPETEFTVNQLGIRVLKSGEYDDVRDIWDARAIFKTNGEIWVTVTAQSSYPYMRTILHPCVIFVKDFGDIPTP